MHGSSVDVALTGLQKDNWGGLGKMGVPAKPEAGGMPVPRWLHGVMGVVAWEPANTCYGVCENGTPRF